jgi:hypothetical protein
MTKDKALKIAAIESTKTVAIIMFIGFYIYMAMNYTDSNYFIALNLIVLFAVYFYMAFEVDDD